MRSRVQCLMSRSGNQRDINCDSAVEVRLCSVMSERMLATVNHPANIADVTDCPGDCGSVCSHHCGTEKTKWELTGDKIVFQRNKPKSVHNATPMVANTGVIVSSSGCQR